MKTKSKISVLIDLYNWLAKLQIKERVTFGFIKKDRLHFELNHPKFGRKKISIPLPKQKFFKAMGIGLYIKEKRGEKVELSIYDYGGIYDPIDDRVMGEHYSTTHFALMGAILYKLTGDKDYIISVKQAINFHIKTSIDEYRFASWNYHWDFNNYSFLETYNLIKEELSYEERKTWIKHLSYAKLSNNIGTNWIAMRAFFLLLRSKLLRDKNFIDKYKFKFLFYLIKKLQKGDGCIDDFKNRSRPIQYHVYTLALIGKIVEITKNEKIKKIFLRGLEYFIHFVDPRGDFNFKGRGQEQIFGYAVAIYVLELGKKYDENNESLYQKLQNLIWNYVLVFKKDDGHFPLVLNEYEDKKKLGWYDYHHLTVYNAFFGVWLGFACLTEKNFSVTGEEYIPEGITFLRKSKVLVVNESKYFCLLSGGETRYLSDGGLTLHHLYIKDFGILYSCPGGPSTRRYGKINRVEHVEQNYLAPIAIGEKDKYYIPCNKKGTIRKAGDGYLLRQNYGPFVVQRFIRFESSTIYIKDSVKFNKDIMLKEFRLFNMPYFIDKFHVELKENCLIIINKETNRTCILTLIKNSSQKKLKKMGPKIKNCKGYVKIVAIIYERKKFKRNQEISIEFKIEI